MTWQIIGHQWAVTLLQKHIASDQLRQAYLISGDDGLGKRTLATQFAQALNCEKNEETAELCGECRACTLIPLGTYPDFHVLEPEEDSSTVKVDQIRNLQQQLALSPFEGRWRIALIADFERATESAANALLKTLEEPSENVIVLLTAVDIAALLPTIVSRCEQLPLRSVSKDELAAAMRSWEMKAADQSLIAGLAEGRPGWALRYAREPGLLESRADSLDQLTSLLASSRGERFDLIDSLVTWKDDLENQRRQVREVLQIWLGIWRDAMLCSFHQDSSIVNTDRMQLIEMIAQSLGSDRIEEGVRSIQRTQEAIEHFANIRLALEVLMLDLPQLGH